MPSTITAARVDSDLERKGSPIALFVWERALIYSSRAAIKIARDILIFPSVAKPNATMADDAAGDVSVDWAPRNVRNPSDSRTKLWWKKQAAWSYMGNVGVYSIDWLVDAFVWLLIKDFFFFDIGVVRLCLDRRITSSFWLRNTSDKRSRYPGHSSLARMHWEHDGVAWSH